MSVKWKLPNLLKTHPRTIWRYAHADFQAANQLLEAVDWESLIVDDIDVAWQNSALDQRKEVAAVFFDLRKAFDSVPHRPLLNKLKSVGLSDHLIKWICSYLTNRVQHVVLNGQESTATPVYQEYPRGRYWVLYCSCSISMTWLMVPSLKVVLHLSMLTICSCIRSLPAQRIIPPYSQT